MTAYPTAEDYVRAVQQPERVFQLPALRRAVFDVHPLYQIPMPASGNAAVVFRARVEGVDSALRFFIREDVSTRERYGALGQHFRTHGMEDCVARATWLDDAITVNGSTWPMVDMQWVEGRTLDAYVGHLTATGNVGALSQLAGTWRDLIGRLQAADFAHGDLQHGNVLVDTSSTLRLIDFDGSWITAFRGGPPPNETGHPNYQRTGREWGRWMDTFPGLVVYTGLLLLAHRPESWERLHNGENIVFSRDDFAPPFSTPTWALLSQIRDPQLDAAAQRLMQACAPGWRAEDTLEALLSSRPRIVVPPPRRPQDAAGRYVPRADPSSTWWLPTGPGHPPRTPTAPGAPPPSPAGARGTSASPPPGTPQPPTMPPPPPKAHAAGGPAWQPSHPGGGAAPGWPHGAGGVPPPPTPQQRPTPWLPGGPAGAHGRRPAAPVAAVTAAVALVCLLLIVLVVAATAA